MTLALHPCPRCARHVRSDEVRCPFCDEALPPADEVAPRTAALPRSRAAVLALGATLALAACRSSSPTVNEQPPIAQPYGAPPDPRTARGPVEWSLTASTRALAMSERATFRLTIAASNRAAAPVDPGRGGLSLRVNGRPSPVFDLAFNNGTMDPRWTSLPPGQTVTDARDLGAALFEAPGEYSLELLQNGLPVAQVQVTVRPDAAAVAR